MASTSEYLTFCPFATRIPADRVDYELWALISLAPIVWLVAYSGAVHARRELHQLFALMGMVFTAGCIKLIKHVWKQPRPSLNCQHLNTCDTYGMPSSHTQLAFFQCTWALLVFLFRTRHRPVHTKQHTTHRMSPSTCIDLLCVAAGWCIALLVGISRVQLGYHSVLQVAVGALAGLLTAGVWFALLVYGARPLHTALVQHGGGGCGVVVGSVLARVLCIRDTLDVGGDVVCVERDLLVGVAALGKKGE